MARGRITDRQIDAIASGLKHTLEHGLTKTFLSETSRTTNVDKLRGLKGELYMGVKRSSDLTDVYKFGDAHIMRIDVERSDTRREDIVTLTFRVTIPPLTKQNFMGTWPARFTVRNDALEKSVKVIKVPESPERLIRTRDSNLDKPEE